MALMTIKNLFLGINPILNDVLQQKTNSEFTWEEFYGHHISDLTRQAKEQLRGTGYTARMEKGLQIRYVGGEAGLPQSDVMIVDTKGRPHQPTIAPDLTSLGNYAIAIKPATAFVSDPAHYGETRPLHGIGIYRGSDQPVAWIELLSPANKPGSSYYPRYLEKRESLLEGRNMIFVEIDYLNRTAPAIYHYPDYTRQEHGATPYRISIIDPRRLEPEQNLGDVQAVILGFGVDQPIPTMPIALYGTDVLSLDAQHAYNKTYEENFYGEELPVLYDEVPATLHDYLAQDQDSLMKRLIMINLAHQHGQPLDMNSIAEDGVARLLNRFKADPQAFRLDTLKG